MTDLLHKDLTYAIIGAAMEIHSELGPGFLESVYHRALAHELSLRQIPYREQAILAVEYKNNNVGEFRADFLIDETVVVELKATKRFSEINEAQLINYLKCTDYRVGLLFNFGTASVQRIRRVV